MIDVEKNNIALKTQTDPFNRSHLTQDMLIPNSELKQRIEEFIRSQRKRGRENQSSEPSLSQVSQLMM